MTISPPVARGILAAIVILYAQAAGAISVDRYLVTGDPRSGTGCSVPSPGAIFSPDSEGVFFWAHFTDTSTRDRRQWRWFAPDNSLYYTAEGGFNFEGEGCAYSGIYIRGAEAASLPGRWRAELYLNGALAASSHFYIGAPLTPGISFTPASGGSAEAMEPFDFSFGVDFGPYLEVYSFSISYLGIDITQPFLSLFSQGYATASVSGGVVTLTVQGLALPSGQHRVTVSVESPGGQASAEWTVSMTPPRYRLSEDQRALALRDGNPSYLTILFSGDPPRREETWTYTGEKRAYTFRDGRRVLETLVSPDAAQHARTPALDPSIFTKYTTLQDLAGLLGVAYAEADRSAFAPLLGAADLRTYHFADKGVFASFLDGRLTVVKTVDIPKGR